MKTETILLLIISGVVLYEYSKKSADGIHWISCEDPNADPVMCGLLDGGMQTNL